MFCVYTAHLFAFYASANILMHVQTCMCVCVFWHVDTHQLLLLHALHENDEQMLGLCAAVGESLLDGHQQLVS